MDCYLYSYTSYKKESHYGSRSPFRCRGAGPTAVPFGATRTLSKEFGADSRELALKIFSGTTLEQFYTNSVFYDRMGEFIAQRQLDGGHVAQFPVIGDDIDLFNALEDNATPLTLRSLTQPTLPLKAV